MKRLLDKKLPMLILCCFIITGMVLTTSPAFSREGQATNDRDNYASHQKDNHASHDRDQKSSYKKDNHASSTRDRSRSVRTTHKSGVIPAIIATGIIAGVTLSLLDNHTTPAVQTAVPATCPAAAGYAASAGSVMVTAELLNIRSGPGRNKPCVGRIHRGARLAIMGNSAGWYYVTTSGGVSGWVMAQYTAPVGYVAG